MYFSHSKLKSFLPDGQMSLKLSLLLSVQSIQTMPFIDKLLNFKSLSIVGMEKNTGKTECLNYIIKKLKDRNLNSFITSIGIDGESVDQVTNTHKPEIQIFENSYFVTSEKHYKQRFIVSEIVDVSKDKTPLGRLITAKAIDRGKVILSGPSNTSLLYKYIQKSAEYNTSICIVDGALSRLSTASPVISDCMILTTGAAVSANINTLVNKTAFTYKLINLPQYENPKIDELVNFNQGLCAIDSENKIFNLDIPSAFLLSQHKEKVFQYGTTLFASGVVSDKMLIFLSQQKQCSEITLIVKDFTRLFITKEMFHNFIRKGGKIKVLYQTNLIAVCVNPTSPQGITLNSHNLIHALQDEIEIPVYDIRNEK